VGRHCPEADVAHRSEAGPVASRVDRRIRLVAFVVLAGPKRSGTTIRRVAMSLDDAVTYPSDAGADVYLLTIRGATVSASLAQTRAVHNATAGAAAGVAAARSLGDLSHNVYAGHGADHAEEVLFIDFWNSLSGLGRFFADAQVQAGGDALFAKRDASVWAAATGFGSYHLHTPSGRAAVGLGVLRARVGSIEQAASAFRRYAGATVNRARRSGIVSHSLWTRVPESGSTPTEVIGIDLWQDPDDMLGYYDLSLGFEHLGPVMTGPPDTSTWHAAPGDWTEW
jgi:hypothetical protein